MRRIPAFLLWCAYSGVLAVSLGGQVPVPGPVNPATPTLVSPQLVPWFYDPASSRSIWDRHRYYEDNANTVFTLAHDFVTVDASHGQPAHPDVLCLNFAQFWPPEGSAAPVGGRQLWWDSISKKGLQLNVNYSRALVDPALSSTSRYLDGTFFLAMDSPINDQTTPPVASLGFSNQVISATRAALGVLGSTLLAPHVVLVPGTGVLSGPGLVATGTPGPFASLQPNTPTTAIAPNAIYITASVGYALADFEPNSHSAVQEAWRDRLMVFDTVQGIWADRWDLLPVGVAEGNSSGVAFADFNGDGRMDLYIGKCGDNYGGARNVLLIWNRITGKFDDRSSWVSLANGQPEPDGATNEVATADIDGDGDLDIAVANRAKRVGTSLVPGIEAEDYYLVNDGTGHFTAAPLAPGVFSDSRSVAIGDLNHAGAMEIVIGNAGSEGVSTSLVLTAGVEDHATEIFRSTTTAPLNYSDQMLAFFPNANFERSVTSPLTQQVLLVDLFSSSAVSGPDRWLPDGWLDLVIVNHRDMLKHDPSLVSVHNFHVLTNRAGAPGVGLEYGTAYPTTWGRTVCVADFYQPAGTPAFPEMFVGTGNRYHGTLSQLTWNRGNQGDANSPWGGFDQSYDLLPGTEKGYGFDFADYTGNGAMDALQTSRTYNYLVRDMLQSSGHLNPHLDFTSPVSPDFTSNARGRLKPRVMEDGIFDDFDGDGDLDAILASGTGTSPSTPPVLGYRSPDTIVLENVNGSGPQFHHDSVSVSLYPPPYTNPGPNSVLIDKKIDPNFRIAGPAPSAFPFFAAHTQLADRVVSGDLDNDGDRDAIVQLFGLRDPTHPAGNFLHRLDAAYFQGAAFDFNPAAPTTPLLATGWRYLKNVIGDPGTLPGTWFRDVAAAQMNASTGGFSPLWNRWLGMSVLADFDLNGRLDLYTTIGAAFSAANGPVGSTLPPSEQNVQELAQLSDLLFLNGTGTDPVGTLKLYPTLLPNQGAVADVILDNAPGAQPGDATTDHAGSHFVAQGDIDNDGDADVIVTHQAGPWRTNLPWLLLNQIKLPAVRKFTEVATARIPFTTMSGVINTAAPSPDPFPGLTVDNAQAATFFDYDADGDLDLVWLVAKDSIRVLRNRGEDTNGDGVIDLADYPAPGSSLLGHFEDVTPIVTPYFKTAADAADIQPVDIDGDGDLDLAVDAFNDGPIFWRNDQLHGSEPRVTEIWPRVGSVRVKPNGTPTTITLHGVRLDGVVAVEFRYGSPTGGASTVVNVTTGLTPVSPTRLQVTLPATLPIGLAQVRVQRQLSPGGALIWSKQYIATFIQG